MGGPGSGGHNRVPTEMHILRGSYRKDRHGPIPRHYHTRAQRGLSMTKIPETAPRSLCAEAVVIYEEMAAVWNRYGGLRPSAAEVALFSILWTQSMDATTWGDDLPEAAVHELLKGKWDDLLQQWAMDPDRWSEFYEVAYPRWVEVSGVQFMDDPEPE